MFKDNEILSRIAELEKMVEAQNNTLVAVGNKINDLLELWDCPPTEQKQVSGEWRTILRYGKPTLCEVNSMGTVRRIDSGVEVPIHVNDNGKPRATIYWLENGRERHSTALIANAVARAFIDPDLPYRTTSVGHIDGDITNCEVSNLYVTKKGVQVISGKDTNDGRE